MKIFEWIGIENSYICDGEGVARAMLHEEGRWLNIVRNLDFDASRIGYKILTCLFPY